MLPALLKKADFDSTITEVEGKTPNISGLATNSSLTAVENKIPDITSLITKTDFDAKLKMNQKIQKITKNKSKDLLLHNELKKLKTFDVDYFEGRNYFEGGDGTQNMLVFQAKGEYFGRNNLGSTQYYTWKSKGTSDENFYYASRSIDKKLTKLHMLALVHTSFLFKMLVRLLLVL